MDDQVAEHERRHNSDQCCKHDEKDPHTPKALRNEGGLWKRVMSDLEKI